MDVMHEQIRNIRFDPKTKNVLVRRTVGSVWDFARQVEESYANFAEVYIRNNLYELLGREEKPQGWDQWGKAVELN
jgi:hypothetical protein